MTPMAAELLAIRPGIKPNWQPPATTHVAAKPASKKANHIAANAAKATQKAREVLIKKGEKTKQKALDAIKQIKALGHEATSERIALVNGVSHDVARQTLNRLAKQNRVIRAGKIGHAWIYDLAESATSAEDNP